MRIFGNKKAKKELEKRMKITTEEIDGVIITKGSLDIYYK